MHVMQAKLDEQLKVKLDALNGTYIKSIKKVIYIGILGEVVERCLNMKEKIFSNPIICYFDFYIYICHLIYLVQRLQFSRETELIEHVLQDVEYRVSTSGKAEVIGKQQDLLNSIQMIYRKPMTSFVTTPVPCDFPR
jgi:hypothetical protein